MAKFIKQIKNMCLNHKVVCITILFLCICTAARANEPSLISKWNENLGIFYVKATEALGLDLNIAKESFVVTAVLRNSAADNAGLKRGDSILSIPPEMWNRPGKSGVVKISRGGQVSQVNITSKQHTFKDPKMVDENIPSSVPRTIVVDQTGKGDCRTITGALLAAGFGDTVLIQDGIYKEGLVLRNGINIKGTDRTHIQGMMAFRSFGSSEITIEELAIAATYTGFTISDSSKITLNNCDITIESGEAISVSGSDGVIIKNCTLKGQDKTRGIVVSGSKVRITDNMIFEFDHGIVLKEASVSSVLHNLLDANRKTSLAVYDSEITAEKNSITGKMEALGIYLKNSKCSVKENSIHRHNAGIRAEQTGGKLINNSISQNNYGIMVALGRMEISDNRVLDNKLGVLLGSSGPDLNASEKAVVLRNKITGNVYGGINVLNFRADIHYNLIEANGAGISVERSTADIRNNTIVLQKGHGISIMHDSEASIYNNILAFNSFGMSSDITCSLKTGFNDVYGNLARKEFPLIDGNFLRKDRLVTRSGEKIHIRIWPAYDLKSNTDISVDPQFVESGSDYRLRPDSALAKKRGKDNAFIGAFPPATESSF